MKRSESAVKKKAVAKKAARVKAAKYVPGLARLAKAIGSTRTKKAAKKAAPKPVAVRADAAKIRELQLALSVAEERADDRRRALEGAQARIDELRREAEALCLRLDTEHRKTSSAEVRSQSLADALAAAMNERDSLRAEKEEALAARDAAEKERDAARDERDEMQNERDAMECRENDGETRQARIDAALSFVADLEFHAPDVAPLLHGVRARLAGEATTQSAADVVQALFGAGTSDETASDETASSETAEGA